jgi:dynactin 1
VQGERYFDCPMGYGMFVRPTTVTVIAQPPPPQPKPAAAARRPSSRPSSMFSSTSVRGPTPSDSGLMKRMSQNAPSPSPVPRQSRSLSVRVSIQYPIFSASTRPVEAYPECPCSLLQSLRRNS